jgi:hypothetical protein
MTTAQSFRLAVRVVAGIKTMHRAKTGQLGPGGLAFSPDDDLYGLAKA